MEKTVSVNSHYIRCPYCHDHVDTDSESWVACQQCLARHHSDCWQYQCSSCSCDEHLQPSEKTSEKRSRPKIQAESSEDGFVEGESFDLSQVQPLDIKAAFDTGKGLFKHKNYLIFALAGMISTLLAGASLFVLAGLLNAGLWLMGLKMLEDDSEEGESSKIGDLFQATDQIAPLTIASFLKTLLVLLGAACLLVPGFILESLFVYLIPLIVQRKLGWKEAFKKSVELVQTSGLKQHFLLVLVTSLITLPAVALSGVAGPLGAVLTGLMLPLTLGPWLAAYRQILQSQRQESTAKTQVPEKETDEEFVEVEIEDGIHVEDDVDAVV